MKIKIASFLLISIMTTQVYANSTLERLKVSFEYFQTFSSLHSDSNKENEVLKNFFNEQERLAKKIDKFNEKILQAVTLKYETLATSHKKALEILIQSKKISDANELQKISLSIFLQLADAIFLDQQKNFLATEYLQKIVEKSLFIYELRKQLNEKGLLFELWETRKQQKQLKTKIFKLEKELSSLENYQFFTDNFFAKVKNFTKKYWLEGVGIIIICYLLKDKACWLKGFMQHCYKTYTYLYNNNYHYEIQNPTVIRITNNIAAGDGNPHNGQYLVFGENGKITLATDPSQSFELPEGWTKEKRTENSFVLKTSDGSYLIIGKDAEDSGNYGYSTDLTGRQNPAGNATMFKEIYN